jgi:hypothetical protein
MTATLEQAIEALRNELQQYGEMLALLEAQQELVTHREPGSILTSIASLEAQSAAIESARRKREIVQRQLAWALSHPEGATLQQLLPALPDPYRPLILAFVQEINALLQRVRECAEQNHSQLRRSLQWMEQLVTNISPQAPLALLVRETNPTEAEPPSPSLPAVIV